MAGEPVHTPGPWVTSGDFIEAEIRGRGIAGREVVARVLPPFCNDGTNFARRRADANARLIAAAPDVLNELELAVEFIEGMRGVLDHLYPAGGIARARAAIAKARGQDVPESGQTTPPTGHPDRGTP